ncbi:AAA family ATPase [Endozoicomonas lisbonensis]|uniref:ATP-binding protein involved in virulence n=1 Tax=Endozoicomonas lisbonensis TaxID=3120522 RepID=A0ABV2SL39_9GAMM
MEIKQFQVTNVGRFSGMEIALAPTPKHSSNITVILGNNGAGKTSLLKSLATSLSWLVARIRSEKGSGSPIQEEVIKNGQNWASIEVHLEDDCGQRFNPDADQADYQFYWGLVKPRKGKKADASSWLSDVTRLADHYRTLLSKNDNADLPLIAFYPVERVVLDIPLKVKTKHTFSQLDGYDNSLNQGVDFRRFFEWFREREDAENESQIPRGVLESLQASVEEDLWQKLSKLNASSRDRQLSAVRNAISHFMPGFTNLRIQRKPRLHMSIDKDGQTLNVAQLSQGEKSLMALVGDIARRLAMMNPSLPNPLTGDGIVLIDEVDLHLHPKWQSTLLQRLTQTFPNCQFVLTTHSPLVINSAQNLLCYSLGDDELHELDSLYGLDANQTLALGLDSAYRNEQVQSKLDDLLDALQDGDLEKARKFQAALKQDLPEGHIELTKSDLLLRKLELRREKNR